MHALAKLIDRTPPDAIRSSTRIRLELEALPQPQRYSEMLAELGQRRAELATLIGQELKDAEREVADLEAAAAGYRRKHDHTFSQSAALIEELVTVVRGERESRLADLAARLRTTLAPAIAMAEAERRRAILEHHAWRRALDLYAAKCGIAPPSLDGIGCSSEETERRAAELAAEWLGE